MLFEYIVDFCRKNYNSIRRTNECSHCNHPSGRCSGHCDNCLDQVHWGPNDNKRADYDCEKLIYRYVTNFTERYTNNILYLLEYTEFENYPFYNILSIGCGATPDLMAIERSIGNAELLYTGYDRNILWKPIHKEIEKYMNVDYHTHVELFQSDIFDFIHSTDIDDCNYNIIVIQYLISHLYNTHQSQRIDELYNGIVKIIKNRDKSTPFLIVINDFDSCNKGRPLLHRLLNTLEKEGYNGHAYAFSKYRDGDLGEVRWREGFQINGHIEYEYVYPNENLFGAALVIELEVE